MDMYRSSLAVLAKEGISPKELFLTGWSQGGVVTMCFLEVLEKNNVAVAAVGTAAAQCDGYVMLSGFLNHPRSIDAPWVSAMFILTAFSYEEYYGVPGLAKALFTDEQYELARKIYMKEPYTEPWPGDLHKLIRKEYFDPNYFASTTYCTLIQKLHAYRWQVKTNVRMYYGDIDECLTIGLAQLPSMYQRALGSNTVEAISAGPDANHRGTYGRATAEWKKWFDSLRAK
jgi:pimeloyl-ACP methyl ester carboxylesterase